MSTVHLVRLLRLVGFVGAISLGVEASAFGVGVLVAPAGQTVAPTRANVALAQRRGDIELHVQIDFDGTAERFGWLLPVPRRPDVAPSSDELFGQLEWALRPSFELRLEAPEGCPEDLSTDNDGECDLLLEVTRDVEAYDVAILDAADDSVVLDWLRDRGFVAPSEWERDVVQRYVGPGRYFVAIDVHALRTTGSMPPLVFRYPGEELSVPLGIGDPRDLDLAVHVFGPHRAVPLNYAHAELNLEHIPWLFPPRQYVKFSPISFCSTWPSSGAYFDVVGRAVDAAEGGRAFTTDSSGSFFFRPSPEYPLDEIRAATTLDELMEAIGASRFRDDGSKRLGVVLQTFVPYPDLARQEGIESERFYSDLFRYGTSFTRFGEVPVDGEAVADAIDAEIQRPSDRVERLVAELPVVTRLATSISSDTVTVDPEFAFNADAPPVERRREATFRFRCEEGQTAFRTRSGWLTLPDGRSFFTDPTDWTERRAESSAPVARRVERLSTEGAAVVLIDNEDALTPSESSPPGLGTAEGSGCGAAPVSSEGLLLLIIAGLIFGRARRRERSGLADSRGVLSDEERRATRGMVAEGLAEARRVKGSILLRAR